MEFQTVTVTLKYRTEDLIDESEVKGNAEQEQAFKTLPESLEIELDCDNDGEFSDHEVDEKLKEQVPECLRDLIYTHVDDGTFVTHYCEFLNGVIDFENFQEVCELYAQHGEAYVVYQTKVYSPGSAGASNIPEYREYKSEKAFYIGLASDHLEDNGVDHFTAYYVDEERMGEDLASNYTWYEGDSGRIYEYD